MFNLDNQFLIFYTGEATKSFFVALSWANVNFQKNGLTVKNQKKTKKKTQSEYTKIKKKNQKKNQKKKWITRNQKKKNQKNPQKKSLWEIIAIIKDTKKNVRY